MPQSLTKKIIKSYQLHCVTETKDNQFLSCVVRAIINSGTKLKFTEKQHWFLELIGQFKGVLQHSSSPLKVLAKFRNFS